MNVNISKYSLLDFSLSNNIPYIDFILWSKFLTILTEFFGPFNVFFELILWNGTLGF